MNPTSSETTSPKTNTTQPKAQKTPSSMRWYAFTTNKQTNQVQILTASSQNELKKQLTEQEDLEVHTIVKGKAFRAKVQKSYNFVDGSAEVADSDPVQDLAAAELN